MSAVPTDMITCVHCGRWIVPDGNEWRHALFTSTTHTATAGVHLASGQPLRPKHLDGQVGDG